jgi:nucleotide-binding universal stress UspA family protein
MTDPLVLVPLDGSKNALSALPIARVFAHLEKGAVRILQVAGEIGQPGKTAEPPRLEPADLGGAVLEVRGGRPAEAILAAAGDCGAAMIVLGAYSADVRPADAIGAAAQAVLCGAHCPVVLVDPTRTTPAWTLRRVVALHDGSPAVSQALRPAIQLAGEAGAELVVLQVASDERALETGSIAPPVYLDQIQHSWPAWSGEFLQRLASICPLTDVRVRLLVAHGEPANETIRVAGQESADLVVLAWEGRWEAAQASTLKALLRDAPCPIMVTRVRTS